MIGAISRIVPRAESCFATHVRVLLERAPRLATCDVRIEAPRAVADLHGLARRPAAVPPDWGAAQTAADQLLADIKGVAGECNLLASLAACFRCSPRSAPLVRPPSWRASTG